MRWISFAWRKPHAAGVAVLAALAVASATFAPRGALGAYAEQVLYRFCAQSNCADGAQPVANLLLDGNGNLYGSTVAGDTNCGYNCFNHPGTVFELIPSNNGWQQKVLHTFGAC